MSTHPRLESRVSVLERRQNTLEALIEELSEDTAAGFKQVDARIGGLSEDMTASFKQLSEYLGRIEDRFDKIEATMATKEDLKTEIATVRSDIKNDMSAMENRILDAFKQLLAVVNPQRPPSE